MVTGPRFCIVIQHKGHVSAPGGTMCDTDIFQINAHTTHMCITVIQINWIRPHSLFFGLACLTSVIWPFTLTALTLGSCLYCVNASHYMDEGAVNFNFFHKGIIGPPTWMHSTNMSQQWGQWEWMVRLVKLSNSKPRTILRWVTI